MAVNTAQDVETAKLAKQMAAVGSTVGQFMRKTEKDISEIRQTQGELAGRVDTLAGEVNKNSTDILLTQQILFDKMSAAEQVAALNNGYLGSLLPADKQRLLAEAMVREKQEELTGKLANFSKGASEGPAPKIAGDLGVDPVVVANIQTASAVADAAGAVVVGLATPPPPVGYIQAGAAITGLLLGGGGPSPEEARHGEIMNALGEIRDRLKVAARKTRSYNRWN